jgi:AraC-like DNA-binding protein
LLEDCSSSFKAPLLGLKLAQLHEPDVYGCVVALCRAAPTVREAIASFIKYIRVTHSPASAQELIEGEKTAELRWYVRLDLGCNQQANYHAALLILKLLRQIGGFRFHATHVTLTVDARPKDIAAIEKYFGCRFQANASHNAIAFPREFLDQSVPSASRVLFTLLSGYLDKVKASSKIALTEQIGNYVRFALPSGQCSIEQCAQKLDMGVRTLQTKLSELGLEFSTILDEQRLALATAYLQQEQLSFCEIAANLGYSEQSSFIRAFKRWTGTTPVSYRKNTRNN